MRTLYAGVLRLYPRALQQQFGEEMLAVHCEASQQARACGFWHHLRFCVREVFGILSDATSATHLGNPFMTRFRWIALGGVAGLLIATLFVNLAEPSYVSSAVVRITQASISDRYVPTAAFDGRALMERLIKSIMTRGSLVTIIQTYKLYPSDIRRMPIEDVIERMRRDVQIVHLGDSTRIAFIYQDPLLAQKVVQHIQGLLIFEYKNARGEDASTTLTFLAGRAEEASREWVEAIQREQAAGSASARLHMDAELARDRYKAVNEKLAEAKTAKAMEEMKFGPRIEMLDPASLAMMPLRSTFMVLLTGLLGGLLSGFVVGLYLSLLSVRKMRLAASMNG